MTELNFCAILALISCRQLDARNPEEVLDALLSPGLRVGRVLVDEQSSSINLPLIKIADESQMNTGRVASLLPFVWITCSHQALLRAPGCAHGRADEHGRRLFLKHVYGTLTFLGTVEIPRLVAVWVVTR